MIILGVKCEYCSFVLLQDIRWQTTGGPPFAAIYVAQFLSLKLLYEGWKQAETIENNGAQPPVSMQPEFTWEFSCSVCPPCEELDLNNLLCYNN